MSLVSKMRELFVSSPGKAAEEIKSSAVGMLISFYNAGRALWSQRDYKAYADEGFKRSPVAFACISRINTCVKYIPIMLMQGDKKIEDHAILDLLHKPNPRQTQHGLIEAMAGNLQVSGNVFLEMVPGGTDPKRAVSKTLLPAELYCHRSDLIKIVPDSKGGVQAYSFEYNSNPFLWEVDALDQTCNIIHMKTWNPTDFYYGLSPMEPASVSVVAHIEASKWNQAVLENSGQPSGALTYKPAAAANLTNDQRQAIKEQLDSAITGAKNARRPLILDGDWDWKQMGMDAVDMDWMNSKTTSATEICMAFNYPPYLMGISDPTYNNAREARAMLYEDTVIPLAETILEYLNQNLCTLYGDDYHLELDLNKIPALSPRRLETWTMVNASTWLTTNEKRGLTGFELVKDDAADEIMVSSAVVPLSTKLDPPEPVAQLDANGNPIPGPEDDPDSDGDDDLSPAREGAPTDDEQAQATNANPPNPANPPNNAGGKNPKNAVNAKVVRKPGANKGGKFFLSRSRLERQALISMLMKESGYSHADATDMAKFTYGERTLNGHHKP